VLAPVVASGNTAVVVTSKDRPLPSITLSEVLATSDVPGGVVNMLTGSAVELAPWLASHADVNALDLTGAPTILRAELEKAAAGTVKRVLRAPAASSAEQDWTRQPDIARLRAYLEAKTVWHPLGV
jgi:acyl-CoA reductase-like NAD-dependent aldehyde dehydrogenase